MKKVIRMDGRLEVTECWRCCGDCVIPSSGELWLDLVTCPECDGKGVLYEYIPGPGEASSTTSLASLFVE